MTINDKFIISLKGKSYVTYEGLLDYAHSLGLKSIEVEILQIPNKENNMTAICSATAKTKDTSFTDLGDASPSSVQNILVPHLIRMASTRAKARALRDLTNIGMTAIEELDKIEETEEKYNNQQSQPMTQKQRNALENLSKVTGTTINYQELDKNGAKKLISELVARANNPQK